MMKNLLFMLSSVALLGISCKGIVHEDLDTLENDVYQIKNVVFFEKGSTIDSVIHRLDTISYTNFDSVRTIDTTIVLYADFQDSVFINFDDGTTDNRKYEDSLLVSQLLLRHDSMHTDRFLLALKDPVYFTGMDSRVAVAPLNEIKLSQQLAITPCLRYDITGAYWRINYKVDFGLEIENKQSGESDSRRGTLVYSRLALHYYPGQDPYPQASQIFISEWSPCTPKFL
ncbi:hypothetical protein [Sphingobacterium griseoflavum]|uniref:Lipoprotein n=1 Tax=Sphingobacterium griseoflavum TaxID=1474952 RepID=A0ABQ3HZI6_9SPHI|nr:hypothetical protein [Sphingobacterium griseoflavum]GHE49395.1 hypothetical protein GCM10017764_35570 [Sphingobacterium griseoflavum]